MKKWTRRAFITTGVLASGATIFGIAIRPGNRASKVKDLVAKAGETVLNIWLKIGTDNVITAIIPHAEMGQGVHTALAMMLADELDADWDNLKIEEAPADKEYATGGLIRGFGAGDKVFPEFLQATMDGIFLTIGKAMNMELTGGSASVRFTGKYAMRVAGAAARSMLLEAAAESWKVPVDELTTDKSTITHKKSNKTALYADFAKAAATRSMPVQPKLKETSAFKIMGTSPKRNDIPAKVNGTASFGMDVKVPNMKYATVKAAPVFGNKIKSVDESGISKPAGFYKMVNLGNAVAVISDSYYTSKMLLNELKVSYTATENDKINQQNIFDNYKKVLDEKNDFKIDFESGDTDAIFKAEKTIYEQEYRVPFLAHAAMEPLNCTVWLQKDKCEVWVGSQNPLGVKKAVADIVDLSTDKVTVYNQYLGGGFGRKSETDFVEQAAKLAKEVPFPVKLIWSREEDVQQDKYREANISRFKAAINKEGEIVAWENSSLFQHHPPNASLIAYAIDNQRIGHSDLETHVPWGNWRSVDHTTHCFFIESFVDELAFITKKDPYLFRKELLAKQARHLGVLNKAAEKSDWNKPMERGSGRGIAVQESFDSFVAEVAEVTVSEAGEVKIVKVTCVADAGFAVHPDAFVAQMESGIIFGLTAALYGEITIENGAVKQSNFHDYEMVRMTHSPKIETFIINSGNAPGGAGEPSTPLIAPAVCNAIFAATGIRIRELPIKKHDLSKANWKV